MKMFALFATAAATVAAFGGEPAYKMVEKAHVYYDGETALHGHLMYQDTGATDRAGLLVFPYFLGAPAMVDRNASFQYAEKGMVVFFADYYGKNYDDSDMAQIGEGFNGYTPFLADTVKAQRIAVLGLAQLTSLPMVSEDKIGVMGFCMGGSMAAELARAGGKAQVAVSFHGNQAPVEGAADKGFNMKYFAAFFGRNDPMIPPSAVEASQEWMASATAAGGDYEAVIYSNTVHGFTHQMSDTLFEYIDSIGYGGAAAYSAKRAKSTFERVDALFKEYGLL